MVLFLAAADVRASASSASEASPASRHPVARLCGGPGPAGRGHLGRRRAGALRLEEAVKKITLDPATIWGLPERGLLREGYAADLMLFDPRTVARGPKRRAHDLPAGAARLTTSAVGLHGVWINGTRVADKAGFCVDKAARPGEVLRSFAASFGRTRAILAAAATGCLLNIPLSWLLIFGGLGLPPLGPRGAGIAVAIIYALQFAVLLAHCLTTAPLRRYHVLVRLRRPDWPIFREILRVGLPIGGAVVMGLFFGQDSPLPSLATTQITQYLPALPTHTPPVPN